MANRPYTNEERQWLKDNVLKKEYQNTMGYCNWEKLTNDFNKKFCLDKTAQQLHCFLRKEKIGTKTNIINEEQIKWVKENVNNFFIDSEIEHYFNWKDFEKAFQERFNFHRTRYSLQQIMVKNNIKLGKAYHKKNRKVIGDEVFDDGDIWIKVKDGKSCRKNHRKLYKMKSRIMYEKYHNCILKDNEYIFFLNDNHFDFSKENLIKISKQCTTTLAHLPNLSKRLKKVALKNCELQTIINEAKGE